jgi:hypothetical protein
MFIILKEGLTPQPDRSNYENQSITHYDKIFFTSRIDEAIGHAVHTAYNTKSHPVVLVLNVPDKNLIISDYDVDKSSGNSDYEEFEKSRAHSSMATSKSFSASKEVGIYGYKGKILPQHIKYILVNHSSNEIPEIKSWKKLTIKQVKKIFDRYGNLDEYIDSYLST